MYSVNAKPTCVTGLLNHSCYPMTWKKDIKAKQGRDIYDIKTCGSAGLFPVNNVGGLQ